jgi:uncharacterized protein with beta-barrel porin domain
MSIQKYGFKRRREHGDYSIDASFAKSPASVYTVKGYRAPRNRATLGCSFNWEMGRSFGLALACDAALSGGGGTEHRASLTLRYRW